MTTCPQTRSVCETPSKCDPPYDCLVAEIQADARNGNMDDRPYFSEFHQAWFFYDETGDIMGPFPSYKRAMKEYKAYCHWLNHGPTLWQRLWWPVQDFLASIR